MSVASVESDLDNLTLTVIADFDAPVEAVWELWADPQKRAVVGATELFDDLRAVRDERWRRDGPCLCRPQR